MATAMNELASMVMNLPDKQRAELVALMLASLPSVLTDQDDGTAEALRRDAEIEGGSQRAMSLEDLDAAIHNRRG